MKDQWTTLVYAVCIVLLSGCKSNQDQAMESNQQGFIAGIYANDIPLAEPRPGEWLYHHEEKGQTFSQYAAANPVSPNDQHKRIYIQPIGDFDTITEKLIALTAEYLSIFFGLETVVQEPLSNTIIPPSAFRHHDHSGIQFHASYILNEVLLNRLPEDAIAVMAITERDLYPRPEWNFVFGLANLRKRVGVTSVYRLRRLDDDRIDFSATLERLIRVTSHELCHMFTMRHCIAAVCTMNGSNSLEEMDRKPNRLCASCTAKLIWNLDLNPMERLAGLSHFFERYGLRKDLQLAEADLKAVR